jgi:hypothetical protein
LFQLSTLKQSYSLQLLSVLILILGFGERNFRVLWKFKKPDNDVGLRCRDVGRSRRTKMTARNSSGETRMKSSAFLVIPLIKKLNLLTGKWLLSMLILSYFCSISFYFFEI